MYVFNSETKARVGGYLEWILPLHCCQPQHLQEKTITDERAVFHIYIFIYLLPDAGLESHSGSLWGPQILTRAPSNHRINTSGSSSHAAHQ